MDCNEQFCKWLKSHSKLPVVIGNAAHTEQFSTQVHVSHVMAAGIAGQPFSSLGDRMEQKAFLDLKGYDLHQTVLILQSVWPYHRTRWWALLAHPALQVKDIPDMPRLRWTPSIMHLIPTMMSMSPDELHQLILDLEELQIFHAAKGGIAKLWIDMLKALPTATNSWGFTSQRMRMSVSFNWFHTGQT